MKLLRQLLPLVMIVFPAGAALAQWGTNPAGDPTYTTTYSTSGAFSCGVAFIYTSGTCTNLAGGAIQLTSGDATLALGFAGTTGGFTASNVSQDANLGMFLESVGGTGPFVFPTNSAPAFELFNFTLSLMSPLGARTWGTTFSHGGGTSISGAGDQGQAYFAFYLGTPPGGPSEASLVYTFRDNPTLTYEQAGRPLFAAVGIVPEPSSFILIGTGLLAIGTLLRRRDSVT